MLGFLKKLFSPGLAANYADLMARGAQIVDVRTPGEYQSGHIKGSQNLPLQQLSLLHSKLRKDRPVITCCASGMRSSSAVSLLKSQGFAEVVNGGSWTSLQTRIG